MIYTYKLPVKVLFWKQIWENSKKENLVFLTLLLKHVSPLPCVHVSWGWRTRTSSRFIKNRRADFGMIKSSSFLNLFFFLFCILFCMYVRIFVQFQTIWIKTDSYQGFHVWGQKGEQTEGRTRKRTAGLWFFEVQGCSCCWPWVLHANTLTNFLFLSHPFGVSEANNDIKEQSALKE